MIIIIYYDCKTSCGLIRDGLFTNWKFEIDFDPWLHDQKRLQYLIFSTSYSSSLWRTATIVFSKINKPLPPLKKAPPQMGWK